MAKKKKYPVEYLPNTEAWMTTFADLVSLMLTFFILLISMSTMDKTGLSDIETSFRKAVSVFSAGDKTELQITPPFEMQKLVSTRELMLAMRQNSKAILKHSTLEHKMQMLAMTPGKIRIEGHTNVNPDMSKSKFKDPWSLSLARTASVLHVLEDEGVNPGRLSLVGYGPSRPVSTEATPFGRSKNRRVEIVIYK